MTLKKILVIAAHPDDEVLGCGGAIYNHVDRGDTVSCCILGEGQTARMEKNKKATIKITELTKAAQAAAKKLGVTRLFRFHIPDNRFDSVDLLDIIKLIEQVKAKIDPDVIYTHHYGDLNLDHRITCQATMTAFRPNPGEKLRSLYAFEVPSSTEWQVQSSEMIFKPNYFICLNEKAVSAKLSAFNEYQTELCRYPHPRSSKAIHNLIKRRGNVIGHEFAEAFEVLRQITT